MISELRALQKLHQIVPILIRHLDAYVELAEQDLAAAAKSLVAKARALALLAISGLFALLMGCLLIVGATWDGEYRLATLGAMAGVFALIAAVAAFNMARRRDDRFQNLRREWRQDRAIVEAWLAQDKDEAPDTRAFVSPAFAEPSPPGSRPPH